MVSLLLVSLLFVGLSLGFVGFLVSRDKGQREPARALWWAFMLGALALLPAATVESLFISDFESLQYESLSRIALVSIGIGLVEETFKFLPLALFLYKKPYFNERTDGIVYFALAGFGFGLPENVLYVTAFGPSVGGVRIVLTLLFHAATTAMIGYVLAKCKVERKPIGRAAMALVVIAFVHGLYDFGLFRGGTAWIFMSIITTLTLSVMLFAIFARARSEDFFGGLSSLGNNTYCRSCGAQNFNHDPRCEKCGQPT